MKLTALEDISKLISDDTETDSVEYKESTGQLERGMETLCAFLNKEGGTVLFGVNDNKKIIGQEVADTTKRNIADAISRLEPTAAVQISYIPLPGSDRKVIALHVEDARFSRPYSYKGRPYIRVESVTTTMPQRFCLPTMKCRNIHSAFYVWPVSEVSTRRYSWITSVYKETFFSCSMQHWHLFSNIFHCPVPLIL